MAEKDISEKILMLYADVFADCENVLAYGGEKELGEGELQPAPTESFYRGEGRARNQFCDVSFYCMRGRAWGRGGNCWRGKRKGRMSLCVNTSICWRPEERPAE